MNRELEARTTCRWALESKAKLHRRRAILESGLNESCAFTYSLLPLLMATEGRPAGKASTECLAFSLAGACLDRTKRAIQG